eukprot:5390321-Pyramimonas_sp.AAC.1
MTPSQQAAALQRGSGGLARTTAMKAPPSSYQFWRQYRRSPHRRRHLHYVPLHHEVRKPRRGTPTQLWHGSY